MISIGCCAGDAACGETLHSEFFEKQVRPILVAKCYECHGGVKTSGALQLDTHLGRQTGGESGAVIIPGKPEQSRLIDAINYQSLEMPPADRGKLSDHEIEVLTKWVASGAVDPSDDVPKLGGMSEIDARSWWAFQPLQAVDFDLSPEMIDASLDASMRSKSLEPNPSADKRTLLRRATYDLIGLPPTSEEVNAFLADTADDAFERVIQRLLDSPQYGEKWGRHWLDVVRYADTAGENTDRPLPHAWRYRNWVLDAFNRDLPYDEFIRLQIAGDIVSSQSNREQRNQGIIATGYLAIARRFGHDIDKDIHLMHEDVIDNLGKNFLGLTIGCARCHDHKYDPISSSDYYALYGIFDSTRFSFPGCEPQGQPRDLVPLMDHAELDQVTADYQQQVSQFDAAQKQRAESRPELKDLMTSSHQLLGESEVAEGTSVSLLSPNDSPIEQLEMRQGEVLQLSVIPGASHGADTTQIEWKISRPGADQRSWSVTDLILNLDQHNLHRSDDGAAWCFLETTDGPVFLYEQKANINGQPSLSGWGIGDTPSVFANSGVDPVSVWTTLPAQSIFVHPGPMRTVSVAWVCPSDGQYSITGRVTDVHPSGEDGVSWRLEHFASRELGAALIQLGIDSAIPLVAPIKPTIPVGFAVAEAEVKNARMHQRGDPEQLGDEIPRRWLTVFGGDGVAADGGSGRQQVAGWIAEQPLTARVMANRIWQWHFGRGLIATPNDFGSRGELPSHPELLDSLAAQFRSSGYRIKTMHRLIMNTQAYQRSSANRGSAENIDPDNRYLSKFSRRRLTAEELRDTILLCGGNLDTSTAQAHPFPAEETWKFTQHEPFNAVYPTNRRSVFLMTQRQRRHPYLALFDAADPNASTPIRQPTTVPTQALYFLNDAFFHEQAALVAQRIMSCCDDDTRRIDLIFQLLFQRSPTDRQRDLAIEFLNRYEDQLIDRWAGFTRILMSSNEFIYLD